MHATPVERKNGGGGGGGGGDSYVFDFPANYTCLGDSYFRCLEIVCLSSQYTLIIPHGANQLTTGISFRKKEENKRRSAA